jgi:hypothetical protein
MTRDEIQTMIREAILAERKRICDALRRADPELDWDSVNGSKFDFSMSMVAIAEDIEKGK